MKAINPVYHHTKEMLLHEKELVELAQKDPQNFAPLYKKYHQQISRYVMLYIADYEKASDVISQIFMKAMQKINTFEYRGIPLASWLYRIAKSEINQSFRNEKNSRLISIDNVNAFTVMKVFEEENNFVNKNKLYQALSSLSEEDLNLIKLRYFEEYSYKEIAQLENIKENNAKVKTFRALQRLKEHFYKL